MGLVQRKRELSAFSDVLLAALSYVATVSWRVGVIDARHDPWYAELIPLTVGLWWLLSVAIRRDIPYRLGGVAVEVRETLWLNACGAGILLALSLLTGHAMVSRVVLVVFPALSGATGVLLRLSARSTLAAWRRRGHDVRHVLVVGPTANVRNIGLLLRRPDSGLRAVGLLVPPGDAAQQADGQLPRESDGRIPVLGAYEQLADVLHDQVVDHVVVCAPLDDPGLRTIVDTAVREGKTLWVMLDAFGARLLAGGGSPAAQGELIIVGPARSVPGLMFKRWLDVILAGAALVLAAPVLVTAALWVKLDDPRAPVIFRQQRVGLHGRVFTCLKFRTMVRDAEARRHELQRLNEMDGPVFKIRNDPRITRVGRVLRRYSLDELPQLWNVLRGDMSLVGPRPPLPDEVRHYTPEFRRRLALRPGLTCLWQVSGRNRVDFTRWMELDLRYVDNWSLWLDLQILLRTIPAVLFGTGV